MRSFRSLSEQEVLALAISLERRGRSHLRRSPRSDCGRSIPKSRTSFESSRPTRTATAIGGP